MKQCGCDEWSTMMRLVSVENIVSHLVHCGLMLALLGCLDELLLHSAHDHVGFPSPMLLDSFILSTRTPPALSLIARFPCVESRCVEEGARWQRFREVSPIEQRMIPLSKHTETTAEHTHKHNNVSKKRSTSNANTHHKCSACLLAECLLWIPSNVACVTGSSRTVSPPLRPFSKHAVTLTSLPVSLFSRCAHGTSDL